MQKRRSGAIVALVAGLSLSACSTLQHPPVSGAPEVQETPSPEVEEVAAGPSAASLELADYYSRVQNGLLARGLLRTDGGGPDAPFGARDLVRNFLKIAFYEEYSDTGGRLVAQESVSKMHRWDQPVSISIDFGPSVDATSRTRDTTELVRFANRLSTVTGHPVRRVPAGSGNFRVLVVNEDERRALGPMLRKIMPNISSTALNTVINLPRSTYCLAFATDPEMDGTYDQAIAVIRAEHPDLLRASCIHEEVAQGLGLSNDYALARPSIFNDDEEFGFLTTHDELLLNMLYDRRLRPGMTESEARPIVEQMASELMGGEA